MMTIPSLPLQALVPLSHALALVEIPFCCVKKTSSLGGLGSVPCMKHRLSSIHLK